MRGEELAERVRDQVDGPEVAQIGGGPAGLALDRRLRDGERLAAEVERDVREPRRREDADPPAAMLRGQRGHEGPTLPRGEAPRVDRARLSAAASRALDGYGAGGGGGGARTPGLPVSSRRRLRHRRGLHRRGLHRRGLHRRGLHRRGCPARRTGVPGAIGPVGPFGMTGALGVGDGGVVGAGGWRLSRAETSCVSSERATGRS